MKETPKSIMKEEVGTVTKKFKTERCQTNPEHKTNPPNTDEKENVRKQELTKLLNTIMKIGKIHDDWTTIALCKKSERTIEA